MKPASKAEVANWDKHLAANPDGGKPLQSGCFAAVKAGSGWQSRYYWHVIGRQKIAVLYLVKRVPWLGELWYAPSGPGVVNLVQFKAVIEQLSQIHPRPLAVKLEPALVDSTRLQQQLAELGLQKTPDIQANRATVMVDLAPDEMKILASFKQKTRYNIRLAQRRGVVVEPVDLKPRQVNSMYALMRATRARAGFFLRQKSYFTRFWRAYANHQAGQLFVAKHDQKILAGAFVAWVGDEALYKDGGSRRDRQQLQAPYFLQWEIIRWLKQRGVKRYDLHGVAPSGAPPSHPLVGLGQFKTGFGPVSQTVGTWELPLGERYWLWRKMGERLTLSYHRRVRQELFY